MSNQDDGGPAFPSGLNQDAEYSRTFQYPMEQGMSVRDYLAASALQGMMGMMSDAAAVNRAMSKAAVSDPKELTARNAYEFADAMIAERAK